MRPQKPQIVIDHLAKLTELHRIKRQADERALDAKQAYDIAYDLPPKCCHTCINYTQDGKCDANGGAAPPEEFAATVGACNQWDDIPF